MPRQAFEETGLGRDLQLLVDDRGGRGLEEVPRDRAVEDALDVMAEDPGLVECFTSRHGGGVAGVHAVLPEPPLPDAAHHLQPPVRELEAIVQRREACLDLGRGDHVLG